MPTQKDTNLKRMLVAHQGHHQRQCASRFTCQPLTRSLHLTRSMLLPQTVVARIAWIIQKILTQLHLALVCFGFPEENLSIQPFDLLARPLTHSKKHVEFLKLSTQVVKSKTQIQSKISLYSPAPYINRTETRMPQRHVQCPECARLIQLRVRRGHACIHQRRAQTARSECLL